MEFMYSTWWNLCTLVIAAISKIIKGGNLYLCSKEYLFQATTKIIKEFSNYIVKKEIWSLTHREARQQGLLWSVQTQSHPRAGAWHRHPTPGTALSSAEGSPRRHGHYNKDRQSAQRWFPASGFIVQYRDHVEPTAGAPSSQHCIAAWSSEKPRPGHRRRTCVSPALRWVPPRSRINFIRLKHHILASSNALPKSGVWVRFYAHVSKLVAVLFRALPYTWHNTKCQVLGKTHGHHLEPWNTQIQDLLNVARTDGTRIVRAQLSRAAAHNCKAYTD